MPILKWLTRDSDIGAAKCVPYRLLEEAPELSAGDPNAGNMLIQGDNLEALKALLPFYAGQVKCIYIDPPYNTRSAFEHYDDNLEHTRWLAMIWPRLELLRDLLSEDGSIWVSIDDNEGHYLKVIMDEVFGRRNFIANVLWQNSPKNTARHFSDDHDHILVFARNADQWVPNPMPRSERMNKGYKNPDNDPRGPWTSGDVSARNFYGAGTYPIKCPSGRVIPGPPNGMYWRVSKGRRFAMSAAGLDTGCRNKEIANRSAWNFFHREAVVQAVAEECRKALRAGHPQVVRNVLKIADGIDRNPMAALKANQLVLDRVDPTEFTVNHQHEHSHTHELSPAAREEVLRNIRAIAKQAGVTLKSLPAPGPILDLTPKVRDDDAD